MKPADKVKLSLSSESDSSEVEALSSKVEEVEASGTTPTTGSTVSASATVPDSDLDTKAGSQE
jgi:hypothetical protein